jgi:hypothetical protein
MLVSISFLMVFKFYPKPPLHNNVFIIETYSNYFNRMDRLDILRGVLLFNLKL